MVDLSSTLPFACDIKNTKALGYRLYWYAYVSQAEVHLNGLH